MATTTFIDFDTRIVAEWLNDVNDHAYNEIASGIHPASAISFTPTGGIGSTDVQAAIAEVAASGGGGGGATTLNDLTDVSTVGVTTGQVLKFNGTSWAPAADVASGGGGTDADTLDGFDGSYYLNYNNFTNTPTIPTIPSIPDVIGDLSNVSAATPSSGQALKWNGSQWAPATDATGGGGGGIVLGFGNSANPTTTEQTTTSTSYSTFRSVSYTKQSATSDLVVMVSTHIKSAITTAQSNFQMAVQFNGGTDHEIARASGGEAFDPGQFTAESNGTSGTWVESGLGAGSVTVSARYKVQGAGQSATIKLNQILIFEVET